MKTTAIIGAGPAGIACALRIANGDQNHRVTLFEKGRLQKARLCPVDNSLECKGCNGVCNVISGIGGAMHYGDSIKISGYPSGRRLGNLLEMNRYIELQDVALSAFCMSSLDLIESNIETYEGQLLKQYPIAEIGPAALKNIVDNFFSALQDSSTKIQYRNEVTNVVKPAGSGFQISIRCNDSIHTEAFDNVVFATGRSGIRSTNEMLVNLGIEMTPPTTSIGIRIEMPSELLLPLYNAHKDFKFSEYYGEHKVKSFCFSNSGKRGGRIKFCHYGDQFSHEVIFLDGHSNIEEDEFDSCEKRTGNIALLGQLPTEFNMDWLDNDFIKNYYNHTKGKPIYESLSSFLDHPEASSQVRPSVSCTEYTVASLFPNSITNSLQHAAKGLVNIISKANGLSNQEIIANSVVLAPEVEFFWPTILVDKGFETNVSGLFVIGDAAGIAQGNLQAYIAGLAAADKILEKA